jgi:hypothetical protein
VVSVNSMEVVHIWDGYVSFSDNIVAAKDVSLWVSTLKKECLLKDENGCHWSQEDCISTEESKEFRGRCQNLPGYKSPRTDDSSENLTTTNVDVLGCKRHEIVCGTDGVGGDVDTEGNNDQANSTECSGCSTTVGPILHPDSR